MASLLCSSSEQASGDLLDVRLSIDQAINQQAAESVTYTCLHTYRKGNIAQAQQPIMAEQSKQPAPGDESEQPLPSRVESLCNAIDNEADGNLPDSDRKDLNEICGVLKKIKGKITDDDGKKAGDELLPQSKREELKKLLPLIKHAFEQCKQPRKRQEPEAEHPADKKLLSANGCYPCKPRPSQQQRKQQEEDEAVSLKLLLRLTHNVLEPEQYYEWTTSYVDEKRIYGWDKEAGELADALVAPDDWEWLFRAAGIAGVHGSGKTALAQKVFVHDKAKDNFAIRLWVCVGPPDCEDRFGLLYRMLDNLGLDTAKVEKIVDESNAVKPHRDAAEARIRNDPEAVARIKEAAAEKTRVQDAQRNIKDATKKDEGTVVTGKDGVGEPGQERQDNSIFNQLLKEAADESPEVEKSKIGVLLYILHMTLSKTSYLIVFDDIRAYRDDGWYSNLTLLPPKEGEWGDRLAYGLPKGKKHRGAVLVTCRKEDDARSMVRTGHVVLPSELQPEDDARIMVRTGPVVRPPRLELEHAWTLFKREYDQTKDAKRKKDGKGDDGKGEDMLLKELEEMKEEIVKKCLGLPVAIAEAAKGFAVLEPDENTPEGAKPAGDQTVSSSKKDMQPAAEEESKDAAADDKSQD